MNEATIKFLDQLAQKLGATGAALWAIMVHGVYVQGAISLALSGAMSAFIAGIFLAVWRLEKSGWFEQEEFPQFAVLAASAVVVIIFFIAICINVSEGLNEFLNPEYSALMQLVRH